MTTSPPREDFRLRSVAVAAYGPTILEGIGYGAAIPIVPLLARQLGATVGQAALVAGLLGVGQLCASLPAGAMIAITSPWRVALSGKNGSTTSVMVRAQSIIICQLKRSASVLPASCRRGPTRLHQARMANSQSA